MARQMLGANTRTEGSELLPLFGGDLQQALREGMARMEASGLSEVRAADIAHEGRIYDLTIVQVQSHRPDQDYGKVIVLADVTRNHEINRLKDELLSSISHELRTPLTNMCSSSEILTSLTAADEEAWREFATMLHGESHRLKALVDDVMEYSQLETQKVQWQLADATPSNIVANAVAVLRAKAEEKDIAVEVATEATGTVSVDPGRLTEVLCRLLDNAIKFTPEHGRVRVATTAQDGMVEFAISDSGVGIAEADRQRIFERFTQIGDVMTGKPAGTGLGLSIAQRIIDAFGGQIWCEDSPLGGAQIRFVLPQTVAR
jgi:signal transduction histidine kinase